MDPIRRGVALESLKNNEHFMSAVSEMKQSLVEQEDNLIRDIKLSDDELHAGMKRIAMMRVLLTDVIDTLDSYILEANNKQFEQEQNMDMFKK